MILLEYKKKILEIKDLQVSFRTNNGMLKAVRGINLYLAKGETLAIVGESGSGKSVSAKSVMGILSRNGIIENGEIIYDGVNLLKLSEKEFHNYRGSRLAMIFQDPLSSLNPIMKIGNQMTEAMVSGGRAKQREAGRAFRLRLKNLSRFMAGGPYTATAIKRFKNIAAEYAKMNRDYTSCLDRARETSSDISDILISIMDNDPKKAAKEIRAIIAEAGQTYHNYVSDRNSALPQLLTELKSELRVYRKTGSQERLILLLNQLSELIETAAKKETPNFFSLAYKNIYKGSEEDADKYYKYFVSLIDSAMFESRSASIKAKTKAVEILKKHVHTFEGQLDKAECLRAAAEIVEAVNSSIDLCATDKDGWSYIFGSSLKASLKSYFQAVTLNKKEQKRFERVTAKYNRHTAKGQPAAKPAPAAITDLNMLKLNIKASIERLLDKFQNDIAGGSGKSSYDTGGCMTELLLSEAKQKVLKVTKRAAYNKALRVMKDVGIADPRIRFRQYPFELSGGMCQRVVIAIALSSNPEILICDEPTTALDVTIQAQILDLINSMKVKYNLSVIFITHNLAVVANMADKVAVMYAGKIVEYGLTEDIFRRPAHPYTWALLSSMLDLDTKEKLDIIPGTSPNMIYPPKGDAFAERNKYSMKIDFELPPPEFKISETHWAATWLLHPKAPKVDIPKIVTDRIARMKKNGE